MEQPAASSALQVDPPPPPAPPHSYDDDSAQEAEEPKRIGAGSFAAIYCIVPGTVVYKVIHRQVLDSVATLKAEFRALDTIYARCSADSIFRLPRSLAFFDPDTEEAIIHTKPGSPGVDLDSLQIFDRATYCMDRVWGISRAARRFIRANFFPDPARRVGPMLCRLYFGRVYEAEQNKGRPRFFTSSNFPLDVARYEALRDRFAGASVPPPPARSVAVGMGQMMAKLHLLGGFDGRDVEFVLAGDGGDGFKLYVIDFNQMRPWTADPANLKPAVDAFFTNDPYFPRPRLDDALYLAFRDGYLDEIKPSNKQAWAAGGAFLAALEAEQQRRDSRRGGAVGSDA